MRIDAGKPAKDRYRSGADSGGVKGDRGNGERGDLACTRDGDILGRLGQQLTIWFNLLLGLVEAIAPGHWEIPN